MNSFTHRDYFRRFSLNVEQYGEILIAELFRGKKMGDTQPGYDILVEDEKVILDKHRQGRIALQALFSNSTASEIRIEVKSKLHKTKGGKASVVTCKKVKFEGKIANKGVYLPGMTHLAVVIVNSGSRLKGGEPSKEGLIEDAWLMTNATAKALLEHRGKSYINVNDIRAQHWGPEIAEIKSLLAGIADSTIEIPLIIPVPFRGMEAELAVL